MDYTAALPKIAFIDHLDKLNRKSIQLLRLHFYLRTCIAYYYAIVDI